MVDEVKPEEDKEKLEDVIDTYAFFSNPVKTGITLFNGMKLILEQITKIEERLVNLEKMASGNQK